MERYRVDRIIGEGCFGKAVLCARITDDKACVVKQVDTSKLSTKDRLHAGREATVLAKLSHPNIVGFFESFLHGSSNDTLCIVMDYADGGDLRSVLEKRKGRLLGEDAVLDWFVQTTLALKHIHNSKILHRDLKPENIFLTSSGKIKLGDFGIAKVLENVLDLTRTAVGTPYYMSPEICQEKPYSYKSDIWSLGCVLYEMVSLRHPFEGRNRRLLMMRICGHEPKPISSRYGAGTRALLPQLLKKDARGRPSADIILRNPLIKDRIRRFLTEEQIQQEFGERNSPSAPGLPRSPSVRGITSSLTPKTNAVGRERPHSAEAARGKQNLKLGIDRLAVGAKLGAGTRAGAARDEALNRVKPNGGDEGKARDGGRRGKQSVITIKAGAQQSSNARQGRALSNVTRAAPGVRVNSPRKSPSPRGGENAAREKGAPSGWKLSRAKPVASPRSERKVEDAPKTNEQTSGRRGDSSSPVVKPFQSPSNAPLSSQMLRGTPQSSPKLLEAVAAIETAAAVVLALPSAAEKPASVPSRDRRGDDGADVGGARGGKARAAMSDARTFSPPLISREVKMVKTPVQQRGRGGGARGASSISKSPSERHAMEDKDSNIRNLSPKERANAVRIVRDRDREKLRAMIAQRRKAGEDRIAQECTSCGSDRLSKLKTPCGRVAAYSDVREVKSQPPLRRILRSPTSGGRGNGKGVSSVGREESGGFVMDVSGNVSRLKRTPSRRNIGGRKAEGTNEGKDVLSVGAIKDPTTRKNDLRAFIAKGRQERRRAKQSNATDEEDADISVWISPPAAHRYRDASTANTLVDDSGRAVGSVCTQQEAIRTCSGLSREALIEGRQLQSDLGNASKTPSYSCFPKPAMVEKASLLSPRGAEKVGYGNIGGPSEGSIENRTGPVSDNFDEMRAVNGVGTLKHVDLCNSQSIATATVLKVAEGSKFGGYSWEQEHERTDANEVMELGGGGDGMNSSWGIFSVEADESRGMQAKGKRNTKSDYFCVEETKGVGRYIGYHGCETPVSEEVPSLHREHVISQNATINNGTTVDDIAYVGCEAGSWGKLEKVETEFRDILAGGEVVDNAQEAKVVNGSQDTFRQKGVRCSELEYSGSRLSVSASESCEADEILLRADVSDGGGPSYHARPTGGSELRGIDFVISRPTVGDTSCSPDNTGERVLKQQCNHVTRNDGVMEEVSGDRGDACGASREEFKASDRSEFPLNLRSEYSYAVRPSLRTPETGREMLSRFGRVKVE